MTGAAWVGWDGNYSFNADGTRIPVESLKMVAFPRAPLSGPAAVHGDGDRHVRGSTLRRPAAGGRSVRRRRRDWPADRPAVAARRAADRRARSGVAPARDVRIGPDCADRPDGRGADAAVLEHVARSVPAVLRAAAVSIHQRGRRRHRARGRRARRRRSPGRRRTRRADRPQAVRLPRQQPGSGDRRLLARSSWRSISTSSTSSGCGCSARARSSISTATLNLHDSTIAVEASGDANLGILQGFYRDIRSSGAATLTRQIDGPLAKPVFSGSAVDRERPRPPAVAATLARGDQRPDIVRRRRSPRRRRAGPAGERRRHVRRAGRAERVHARGAQSDGGRHGRCGIRYPGRASRRTSTPTWR